MTPDQRIKRPIDHGDHESSIELDESECFDLLRSADLGRVAVQLPGGGADIFPVDFVFDEGSVLIRTAGGTKLDSLQREPTVAFEADFFDYFERTAWSVVMKGDASLVEDHNELFRLLNVNIDTWHPERKPFFVRIVPRITTGRRFAIHRRVEP